jgi:hypothetical protein
MAAGLAFILERLLWVWWGAQFSGAQVEMRTSLRRLGLFLGEVKVLGWVMSGEGGLLVTEVG